MVSNSKQIKEKTQKFQIVSAGRTNLCKHCTIDLARVIMKLGISQPPHYPIAEVIFHVNSKQRAGKTTGNLFHMIGGRFHAFNT